MARLVLQVHLAQVVLLAHQEAQVLQVQVVHQEIRYLHKQVLFGQQQIIYKLQVL
jgi:hypothetical protein